MPQNFSLVYGLLFCAGVFYPGRLAWWIPLGVLVATDLALNVWYQGRTGTSLFTPAALLYMSGNYLGYLALLGLGRQFKSHHHYLWLLGGGLLGAVLFYLITNTAAWLFNPFHHPEYTRDLGGWVRALTLGAGGYPETWTFFRNTLLSSGLFTLLFTAVHRITLPASTGLRAPAPDSGTDDPAISPDDAEPEIPSPTP